MTEPASMGDAEMTSEAPTTERREASEPQDLPRLAVWLTMAQQTIGSVALIWGLAIVLSVGRQWVDAVRENTAASKATRMETSIVVNGRSTTFAASTEWTDDNSDARTLCEKTDRALDFILARYTEKR